MNLQFTKEELDFQKEVRDWIKDNYPEDMKDRLMNSPNGHVTKEEHVQWQQALFSKGWAGVNWPKEYGGASFTASQKYLFSKEKAAARAPGFTAFGISMVAPLSWLLDLTNKKLNTFLIFFLQKYGGVRVILNLGLVRILLH